LTSSVASFIAIFGFFMVAPRMHERYLYPALALVVPLALEAPEMLAVFVILTITCLINLAYVLHTLNTVVFLDSRDTLAMVTSALNVVALGLSVYWGVTRLRDASTETDAVAAFLAKFAMPRTVVDYVEEPACAPPWISTDTIIITLLLIGAAITRFWNLSHPAEIVFDEVHFVAQGRHYIHGESFLDPHPPLAKLVISLGILIFGDQPFGVWPWAQPKLGNTKPVVLNLDNGIQVQRIAALKPDLIVATDAGLDQDTYQKLTAIAPTLPQSDGNAFFEPWKDQATAIGQAVFQLGQIKSLVNGVDKSFAAIAEKYPQFKNKRAVLLQGKLHQDNVVATTGWRTEFLTQMGLPLQKPPQSATGAAR